MLKEKLDPTTTDPPVKSRTIRPPPKTAWSLEEITQACSNIGYDLSCSACASVFFCGYSFPTDTHTCDEEP